MASKIELKSLVKPRSMKTFTPGETVQLQGMVFNTRVTKWGGFILLRKPEGVIQIVIQNDKTVITDEKGEAITLKIFLDSNLVSYEAGGTVLHDSGGRKLLPAGGMTRATSSVSIVGDGETGDMTGRFSSDKRVPTVMLVR